MTKRRGRSDIIVGGLNASATRGVLRYGWLVLPCALGRGGRRAIKSEGDGATPIGRWPLREVLYRADRLPRPRTALRVVRAIARTDGWCDSPSDANYNARVSHPYKAGAERLWRDDQLYDVVAVLGYNDRPRARGRGSAIFMHLAAPDYAPTQGCVALSRRDLLRLLATLPRRVSITITP